MQESCQSANDGTYTSNWGAPALQETGRLCRVVIWTGVRRPAVTMRDGNPARYVTLNSWQTLCKSTHGRRRSSGKQVSDLQALAPLLVLAVGCDGRACFLAGGCLWSGTTASHWQYGCTLRTHWSEIYWTNYEDQGFFDWVAGRAANLDAQRRDRR